LAATKLPHEYFGTRTEYMIMRLQHVERLQELSKSLQDAATRCNILAAFIAAFI